MDSCCVYAKALNAPRPPSAKVPDASPQSKLVRAKLCLSVAVWITRKKSGSSAPQLRPPTRLFCAAPRTGATAIPAGALWCLCYHQVLHISKEIRLFCSSSDINITILFPSDFWLSTYRFSTFPHSSRRWASSISRGDISSLCTRPSGGSGSAVCSVSAGLQEASPRTSAETAGVWHWAGHHRWSHHLQCWRQHFSGKNKEIHSTGRRGPISIILFLPILYVW